MDGFSEWMEVWLLEGDIMIRLIGLGVSDINGQINKMSGKKKIEQPHSAMRARKKCGNNIEGQWKLCGKKNEGHQKNSQRT